MNNKASVILWIILGIVVFLLIVAVGFYFIFFEMGFVGNSDELPGESAWQSVGQEQPENTMPTYDSIDDCEELEGYTKEYCYKRVAEFTLDKSVCELIENNDGRISCYTDMVCETGDISICEMLEEELGETYYSVSSCYYCVAVVNNDISVCEKIWKTNIEEECYDELG